MPSWEYQPDRMRWVKSRRAWGEGEAAASDRLLYFSIDTILNLTAGTLPGGRGGCLVVRQLVSKDVAERRYRHKKGPAGPGIPVL
jgi:hypothetical protein